CGGSGRWSHGGRAPGTRSSRATQAASRNRREETLSARTTPHKISRSQRILKEIIRVSSLHYRDSAELRPSECLGVPQRAPFRQRAFSARPLHTLYFVMQQFKR